MPTTARGGYREHAGRPRALDEQQERDLLEAFRAGATNARLARQFKVSTATVRRTLDRVG